MTDKEFKDMPMFVKLYRWTDSTFVIDVQDIPKDINIIQAVPGISYNKYRYFI